MVARSGPASRGL